MQEKIGPAIRRARTDRGLSLRALASVIGVSASQLSQIETGKSQASVSTLYELVNHLGLSLDALLKGDDSSSSSDTSTRAIASSGESSPVQRASDNPVLEMANGVRWERLASVSHSDVDVLRVTYQPGAASSVDRTLMRHQGIEYAYLMTGELSLLIEFEQHVIRTGDSVSFDSTRPHLYINFGSQPASGIWFVAGRRSAAHTRDWVQGQFSAPGSPTLTPLANAVEALEQLGHPPAQ
jgi:transcriptional regulator with XRE-family HTH domain